MSLRNLLGGSTAAVMAAGLVLASAGTMQAAMLPAPVKATSYIQHVDCAIGAHIGPLGACIFGDSGDAPPPAVIERRAADAPVVVEPNGGCTTTSVKRTNSVGDSETKTKTNC
jgi:hypothetical protein